MVWDNISFYCSAWSRKYSLSSFKIAELDARSRGLKHPKFLGFIAIGGQNSSGLILYLIGRHKYPSTLSNQDREVMNSRKKKVGVGLIFIVSGAIGLIINKVLIG